MLALAALGTLVVVAVGLLYGYVDKGTVVVFVATQKKSSTLFGMDVGPNVAHEPPVAVTGPVVIFTHVKPVNVAVSWTKCSSWQEGLSFRVLIPSRISFYLPMLGCRIYGNEPEVNI